jgi:hypothetical protein
MQHIINMSNTLNVFEASLQLTREGKYLHTKFKKKMHKTCKKFTFPLEGTYLNHTQYQDSPNCEDAQK